MLSFISACIACFFLPPWYRDRGSNVERSGPKLRHNDHYCPSIFRHFATIRVFNSVLAVHSKFHEFVLVITLNASVSNMCEIAKHSMTPWQSNSLLESVSQMGEKCFMTWDFMPRRFTSLKRVGTSQSFGIRWLVKTPTTAAWSPTRLQNVQSRHGIHNDQCIHLE